MATAEVANGMSEQVSREALLSVEGLTVEFATERGWVTVVRDVSFTVERGETVGLVGESGSGKTVTGLSIMRLIPTPPGRIAAGRILLNGIDLASVSDRALRDIRGNDVAMVFQEPMSSLNPAFSVGDQVAEVIRRHRGGSRRSAFRRAVQILDLVGIPRADKRANEYPHEFSGGMRQRVMLAIALACEPQLLIADEPTTALDVTVQAQVLELLLRLKEELDMALLLVTHDLGVVAEACDRVIVMYAGEVVETAQVDELYASPKHPYTDGLLMSLPQLDAEEGAPLVSIPGRIPEPWATPQGCRFHPRCRFSIEACREPDPSPALLEVSPGRLVRCIRVSEIDLRGER